MERSLSKNSREYIQFLDKRFIKKYLRYADTIYWNYDLGDTIKKYVSVTSQRKNGAPSKLVRRSEYYKGKTVIVNGEAVMNGKHALSQLYQNKNNNTRINALDMQNKYCEREGAAIGFIVRNYLQENVMVVSNDTDAVFYYVIASSKRNRVSNEFSHKFLFKIVIEYWNINELIYSI